MPLRYKIGDKLRVKSDISVGFVSDECEFVGDMEEYRGCMMTVESISSNGRRYIMSEDSGDWYWVDDFFEDTNKTFAESNVVVLKNGQVRLIHNNSLYLPNGTYIEAENYNDRKHNFDDNFDIIEVHRKSTGNYLFDLSGELVQEEK